MILPRIAWQPDAVAHHYDELDVLYRELWGEHMHHGLWLTGNETPSEATLQLLVTVAQHARLQPDAAVCDVGAGYGATSRWLALNYNARVTALTVSPAQYAYAQAQSLSENGSRPNYLLQDWLTNSLPAQTFDTVLAIESTEHMADKHRCFSEALRVLHPGGRFVICAWLARESPRDWEVRFLLEPICREGRLAGLGSASEYCQLLQQAGFVVENSEDVSVRVQRTWTVVLQRMLRGLGTKWDYWRYLLDREKRERVFGLTVMRMWLAYRVGALRYGIVTAYRP
ncbi:MAG: class I SAM-dependent methyltransferase [bacterium]